MRRLADSKDTTVYEYAYETPVRSACPEQALKLAKAAALWRQGPSAAHLSDEEARRRLVSGEGGDGDVAPLMSDFSKSFPRAFEMITKKDRGPEHFLVLEKMARLAAAAEVQRIPETEATAQVNLMLQHHCARGTAASSE